MQKIIGLDIGSYSIKAVEIVNNFKSYEISNFYEVIIPYSEDENADNLIPSCMEQLFAQNQIEADRIIAAMPGQYISSRILSFNFSDNHKINAAVQTEIEDIVPFNLDDMIIDHQILGQMDSKTHVLVVMTKKNFLSSFLSHLQRVHIDPKLVDIDSLSFYNLSPYLSMESGKIYGIIDVGHEKTSVCLIQDGVLKLFRSINLGGRYLTEFLARDFELSFKEAQELKHRISRVIPDENASSYPGLNPDDFKVAKRLTVSCNAILKELGRTLYAFKTWEKAPLEKIFLSGGTSLIQGFDELLSKHLEVQIAINHLDQGGLKSSVSLTSQMPIMPQGIAIGLRAVTAAKKHSQINLRKGEFAYVQDYESLLKGTRVIFKTVSFALLVLCIAYVVRYWSYSTEIERVQDLYRSEFVNGLSDKKVKQKYQSKTFPFMRMKQDAETMINDSISSKKQTFDDFIASNSESGSLSALRDLSLSLSKDIKINVVEYNYRLAPDGSGKILIRIETDSFQTIDQFKTALTNMKGFSQLEEKSSDTKPGTDIKMSVIEITYTPNSIQKKSS